MNITVKTRTLLESLKLAAAVIDKKAAPVLQNVKLAVGKKEAFLFAADTKCSLRLPLDCRIHRAGVVVLPLQDLRIVLKATKVKNLMIYARNGKLFVCEDTEDSIHVKHFPLTPPAQPDTFPDVLPFKEKMYYEFPPQKIEEALQRVLFAAEKPPKAGSISIRPLLTGICLEAAKKIGTIDLIAVDGFKLAWQSLQGLAVGKPGLPEQSVIPQKPLRILEKMLKEIGRGSPVKAAVLPPKKKNQPGSVCFSIEGAVIGSALMHECSKFPLCRKLAEVGKETPYLQIFPAEILPLLDQLSVLAKLEKKENLILDVDKGILRLSLAGNNGFTLKANGPKNFKERVQVHLENFYAGWKAVQNLSEPLQLYFYSETNPPGTSPKRNIRIVFKTLEQTGYVYVLLGEEPEAV